VGVGMHIMSTGHFSVALLADLGNRIAGAPTSYALRTSRDSENFLGHGGGMISSSRARRCTDEVLALPALKYVCS